ncbi:anaerobic ribonucleoside-triphosphate reductase activating protein [Syntrophus gentianae]|uniref:Anaerobic ribonucleoside-triphosphate reductase-activating protein n=1 Tax=Syntrophus gentianae TaxID=43775 RepID=A0A1H8BCS2_9BACT|nr:4Fe-4S single cluster domain-containing protein [Syntrophus gentianae]SEM79904.1 anaerobic ribonucleoside-triphosphate reductase activating protein [Syntrophus gentianae]
MIVQIHAYAPFSRANGPGVRSVVWFQGSPLACPECFNPETHDPGGGHLSDTEILAGEILRKGQGIEGISLTGGEPFSQPEALLDFVQRLKPSPLSILVFSGYEIAEIRQMPNGSAILNSLDILIAGPYDLTRPLGRSLLGSSNQTIHFLTNRYTYRDFKDIPSCEAIIHPDGVP